VLSTHAYTGQQPSKGDCSHVQFGCYQYILSPLPRPQFLKICLLFLSVSQRFSQSSTSRHRGPLNYTRRQGRSQWARSQGRKNPRNQVVTHLSIKWREEMTAQSFVNTRIEDFPSSQPRSPSIVTFSFQYYFQYVHNVKFATHISNLSMQ
jgi:hypothetical protein